MDYTAEITVRTSEPLSKAQLAAAAELGGVASAHVGGTRLTVMFTQRAIGPNDAVSRALARLTVAVGVFYLEAIEVATTEEADRRLVPQ